jgi:ankyrin repeat protein
MVTLLTATQGPSDRYYAAVRNNNIASLRTLLQNSDVNLRDNHGTTPLMYASALGSIDAMRQVRRIGTGRLIDKSKEIPV